MADYDGERRLRPWKFAQSSDTALGIWKGERGWGWRVCVCEEFAGKGERNRGKAGGRYYRTVRSPASHRSRDGTSGGPGGIHRTARLHVCVCVFPSTPLSLAPPASSQPRRQIQFLQRPSFVSACRLWPCSAAETSMPPALRPCSLFEGIYVELQTASFRSSRLAWPMLQCLGVVSTAPCC